MRTHRRRFLAAMAAGTVGCGSRPSPWRFFTREEGRTLQAVCACLVPADQDPGAAEAGVVTFLDRQLTGFYEPLQKTYREGIAAIDAAATARFGAAFADLSPARQGELLHAIEKDKKTLFFDMLVSHTMQGYYGSPRHGGNRDAVSWKMLGVPYPPVRGQVS